MRLAVLGPAANCSIIETRATHVAGGKTVCNMLGSYTTGGPFTVTPTAGLAEYADVVWSEGTGVDGSNKSGIAGAAALAVRPISLNLRLTEY